MGKQLPIYHSRYHEIFYRSLTLYQRAFSAVFFLSSFVSFLVFFPRIISIIIKKPSPFVIKHYDPYWLLIFLINLLGLIIFMSILWKVSRINDHHHAGKPYELGMTVKKILNALAAALLQNIMVFAYIFFILACYLIFFQDMPVTSWGRGFFYIYSILQFFLMLYLSAIFIFIVPIISTENLNIFAAIEKSISLVWNHWWRVFSTQITPWIIYFAILSFIRYGLKININFFLTHTTQTTLLSLILNLIILSLFLPWVASTLVLQLRDLEHRKQRISV